jgi:anti-sigma factor RsiW
MKHKQFENWILFNKELSRDQQQELHLHLKTCSNCQAVYQSIHQLDHLFRTAPVPSPAAGFSARWMDRIDKVERRRNQLILGITLAVISLATLILLSLVGWELRTAVDFFPQMLLQLITQLAEWLIFINQLSNIVTPLLRVGAKFISPLWIYTLVFSLSGAAVWILGWIRSRSLQKELNS